MGGHEPRPWTGVDLDGTLAQYGEEPWDGISIGKPVPLMVALVKKLLKEGGEVRIFTARASTVSHGIRGVQKQREAIREWCVKHIGVELPVTCEKDYWLTRMYDDRCVQVERNTGRLLSRRKA